jgi:peptide-methionine (S)-S-oxide reductase
VIADEHQAARTRPSEFYCDIYFLPSIFSFPFSSFTLFHSQQLSAPSSHAADKLKPNRSTSRLFPISIALFSAIIFMAFNPSAMPSFVSRFLRPFTSSSSLSYQSESLSAKTFPANTQKATLAAGCFWGVEHHFRKEFGNGKGLLATRVGYTGGASGEPTYRTVCSGTTGHAESLLIMFDPDKVSYRKLLEFFFNMHDPTTLNKSGGDEGTQYRSAIFAHDEEQLSIAQDVKERVGRVWWKNAPVTTEVAMAGPWYDAEDYHQLYLDKNPWGYQCSAHGNQRKTESLYD